MEGAAELFVVIRKSWFEGRRREFERAHAEGTMEEGPPGYLISHRCRVEELSLRQHPDGVEVELSAGDDDLYVSVSAVVPMLDAMIAFTKALNRYLSGVRVAVGVVKATDGRRIIEIPPEQLEKWREPLMAGRKVLILLPERVW